MSSTHPRHAGLLALAVTTILIPFARGQSVNFPPGTAPAVAELPSGRFQQELRALPPVAQARARAWLNDIHFTENDVHSMHADASGGICFACRFHAPPAEELPADESEPTPTGDPVPEAAAIPIDPFPESLKFSSRPGATNVIYINFSGQTIEGTEWNTVVGRTSFTALPFSTDSDYTTFSDAEQTAIKRVWQRMAEDYAPFDVNVTTEPPQTLTNRTAVALVTRNTDSDGNPNPFSTAGGVAYVNVFGRSDFASRYSPAWVYQNNLSNNESFIAEAASHEIGHNLGLSHDGLTTGAEYYGGHGSGETSWGTIMGTGYNRNVSQWSKGEYFNANNTQDDLAVIAGKLAYRPDDHGNTPGTATALVISGGNQVASTDFETDPDNTSPDNKGILERNTDLDVFSFVHGNGPLNLAVAPFLMPAGTRGGNLDVRLELYNETGQLVTTSAPSTQTGATLSTTLTEGQYFLHVRNDAAGSPLSSPPTGYTSYGSIGTYHLSGTITPAIAFNPPPLAQLQASDLTAIGQSSQTLTVTYSDDFAINTATIDSADIRVTGPGGYDQLAQFVSINDPANGSPRVVTYSLPPPSGSEWTAAHNGTYIVAAEAEQVADTQGAFVAAGPLGGFEVALPVPVFSANMDFNPGWTLQSGSGQDPGWEFGPPAYGTTADAPASAFTGGNIIAYNLGGNYPKGLGTPLYATTAPIDVSAASNLTLQFRRWLRLTNQGTGTVEVSTNGSSWTTIWTGSSISDTSWQLVQYALPSSVEGSSSLQIRWGLSSGNRPQTDIGWNIDDVLILGDGALDTDPPAASLNVGGITLSGTPSHSCSVTFTDDTAVRLASLDELDLVVTGPNGYTTFSLVNEVETSTLGFIGADLGTDGSPLTASYDIPAPDGSQWASADNGTYTITLRADSVEDTLNNTVAEAVLGTFEVAISEVQPAELTITPEAGLTTAGEVGGPFSPPSITFTLGNTGGEALAWTASKTAPWFDLSAASGTIQPAATVEVTVSLNAQAAALEPGDFSDIISFVNTTSGIGNTSRDVSLTVSPASVPTRFSSYGLNANGVFEFVISGTPGTTVAVEWSNDLNGWNPLVSGEIGPEGTVTLEDPTDPLPDRRFYRVTGP
ncbi:zinc-dependent metalloprotease family protein [Haloferula sp. A504]|uniref:BACON domain-containing protein n=1 Tax=Haloferula sp. A504 TaxID=3373601 RepID=UPI0031C4910E|nr:hypothetical protein [Verrucomicrobiaceae bacterium E54]